MNPHETTDLVPSQADEDQMVAAESASADSIGVDEFGGQDLDPFAGATAGRKVNGSIILIVAVVLSAVAGLFSMRKIAEVTAATGIDSEIEGFETILTAVAAAVERRHMELDETTQENLAAYFRKDEDDDGSEAGLGGGGP